MKWKRRIGFWNVRTLREYGKLKDNRGWNKKYRKIMEWGKGYSWRSQRLEAFRGCHMLHKEQKELMLLCWLIDLFLARCYVNRVYMPYSAMIRGWTVPDLSKTKSEESAYCFKLFTINVTFIFKVKFRLNDWLNLSWIVMEIFQKCL